MTDKIMINDIDISGCEHRYGSIDWKTGEDRLRCTADMEFYCDERPSCYYKQLQRKTEECNRYKQALDKIEKSCKDICEKCENKDTHWCNNDCDVFNELSIINEIKDV